MLLVFSLNILDSFTQINTYSGRVIDSITGQPLAFVNIIYNTRGIGTISSIDGRFEISLFQKPEFLKFSYVGYWIKLLDIDSVDTSRELVVELNPKAYNIDEVVVFPGVNPAHRIIKQVSVNRLSNHPERINSFTYIAYDKMIFTLHDDTVIDYRSSGRRGRGKGLGDTADTIPKITGSDVFPDEQHILIMESISSRKYKYPDKEKTEIIASRVSGFEKPSFVLMARQFQSFSFYDNLITISNRQYVNPISSGSTSRYFFLLEDTLFTERNDTVFIISFKPKKGRNFNGLKGVLYINSNKYAVQNVIAEAYESDREMISVKIQQKYELIDGQKWFPVQLNTNVLFNNIATEKDDQLFKVIGIGKSYILNIRLNPELDNGEFSSTYVDVAENAHLKAPDFWNMYRVNPLTDKDRKTYKVIDSLGRAKKFDQNFKMMETLFTGYIPGRFLNIRIGSLVDYNSYEGWRLGIGGISNEGISRLFNVGGHIAYGFRDKELKYGYNLRINLYPDNDIFLLFKYRDDLAEAGGYEFIDSRTLLSSEYYRRFMIENMDHSVEKEIFLGLRLFKYLQSGVFINNAMVSSTNGYMFSISDDNPAILMDEFTYTEIGVKFRYSYKEGFMKTPYGNKFSLGTNYPVLNLNLTEGTTLLDGDFRYTRIEAKISKTFTTKSLGRSRFQIVAGKVFGNLPYSKLYNGHGSYKRFTVETENSFATMRHNEFLSDRFISFYFKHNFGSLIFKSRFFSPEFAIATNIGVGYLDHPEKHNNFEFETMEKGYYESGLLVNNILAPGFVGYGFGIFYRYGPYAFSKSSDNFAYKLTIKFNL
jgi:hypothetical protein